MKKVIGEIRSIFLGSIGTIVETSEIQRHAFNSAFKKCGVPWLWEKEQYKGLLVEAGGKNRIQNYAEKQKFFLNSSEIRKVYEWKNHFFKELICSSSISPRAGIESLLNDCSKNKIKICWVTTADDQVVASLKKALNFYIDFENFELITTAKGGLRPKPDPAIYCKAISEIGIPKNFLIAVEDSASGLKSAHNAGVRCLAIPGELKRSQQYHEAEEVLDSIRSIYLHPEKGRAIMTVETNRQ